MSRIKKKCIKEGCNHMGESMGRHGKKKQGEKPKGLTIERINNNKGYSPKNCKWATVSENMLNRRKWTWKKK